MERRRFLQAVSGAAVAISTGTCASAERQAAFSVVGYLPWYRLKTWSAPVASPLTDLVYFGVQPTTDGELPAEPIDRAALEALQKLKGAVPCRLHLCVGGGDRSAGFPRLVERGQLRRAFVRQLRELCQRGGFDGVDYDWEYPAGAAQLADYRRLIEDSRKGLGDQRQITVAQSPWRDFGRGVYEAVDRVHVMSYNHKHPHARVVDAWADVGRMLKFGCPREKLVLGVPFYGRNQRGRSRTFAEIAGSAAFAAGVDLVDGFAFNSGATVQQKLRYARSEQLAGLMIWEVGQDTADPERSLLGAIGAELKT